MNRWSRKALGFVMVLVWCGWAPLRAQGPVNPPQLSEPPPANPEFIDYEQTLVRRLGANPPTLNPLLTVAAPSLEVLELVYDRPLVFDDHLRPGLNDTVVETYRELEDHKTATLVLKPGLKWHDGEPFTVRDIVFSWELLRDARVPVGPNRNGPEQIAACEAVGEREVRFTFENPSPVPRVPLAFPIVARHVFEPIRTEDPTLAKGEKATQANRRPVGNGPYRLVEWNDNQQIVLERWEDYPGPKPFFTRIVFRILNDPKMALLALRKGEIDEMRLSPEQFDAQTKDADFARMAVAAKAHQWQTVYLGWNMSGSNPFFADARVRRAMSCALDADQLLETVCKGLYSRSLGLYTPDAWMFNPEVKPIGFSLAQASDLLDQAGWKIDAQTGWRTKDGVPLAFEVLCPQGVSIWEDILTFYQQTLRSIGVNMKPKGVEWRTLSGLRRQKEFQAYVGSWTTSVDPDEDRGLWHSAFIAEGSNDTGYRNPQVDELFDRARRELDPEKRRQYYQRVHKLIYDDQPVTFVSVAPSLWAFNKNLHGVKFSLRGPFHWHPGPHSWWVKRGEWLRTP